MGISNRSPLWGRERMEVPVVVGDEEASLVAWKDDRDEGSISLGVMQGDDVLELVNVSADGYEQLTPEIAISALPGTQELLGPHVLLAFSPSDNHVTLDATLHDAAGARSELHAEGSVDVAMDAPYYAPRTTNEPDVEAFVKLLRSALACCSPDGMQWLDDVDMSLIQGGGKTYLDDGSSVRDITGSTLLYVCRSVIDILIERSPEHPTRVASVRA